MRPSEDVARFAPRKRIHSLTHDLSRFKYVLLGVAALIVVVVGFVGWMQTDPSLPPWEALYRTLALFTISMPDGLGGSSPVSWCHSVAPEGWDGQAVRRSSGRAGSAWSWRMCASLRMETSEK